MIVRFDIRPDPTGWTVYDRTTSRPTVVDRFVSGGRSFDAGTDLVDLLNTLNMLKPDPALHEPPARHRRWVPSEVYLA